MLCHGFAPNCSTKGTMVPIPKVKATNCSEKFRAITMSSMIGKILDIVIFNSYEEKLSSCDLQFGFKKGSSTFVAQEVITYYAEHGSTVYSVLLDASKEFCMMFKKLINRNICAVILRLLLFMYTYQTLCVRWNSKVSQAFSISNGVKQGGVISRILYCVYTDDLLLRLKTTGYGCFIGSNFCGSLAYADDIILLSPKISGMKKMLDVCNVYALEHKILFNGGKSQLLIYK